MKIIYGTFYDTISPVTEFYRPFQISFAANVNLDKAKEYFLKNYEDQKIFVENVLIHKRKLNYLILSKHFPNFDFRLLTNFDFKISDLLDAVNNNTFINHVECGKLNYVDPFYENIDSTDLISKRYFDRSRDRNSNSVSHIIGIIGPMGSGKTTELIEYANYYTALGKNVCCLKKNTDNRYSTTEIVSHDGLKVQAVNIGELFSGLKYILSADVICIDEIQFFITVKRVFEVLIQMNKIIIYTGLNGIQDREPINNISLLIPYTDELKIKRGICFICKNFPSIANVSKNDIFVCTSTASLDFESWDSTCHKCHQKLFSRIMGN